MSGNEQLRSIVERVERLEEEKKTFTDDIRDVYAEAKGNGFDVKAIRAIVRMRKQDAAERRTHEAILETYMHELGMLASTELGEAAIARKREEMERRVNKAATSPAVQRAVKNLGTPVPLTEEEKAKGYTAAFEKNGSRMAVGLSPGGDP